MSDAYRWYEDYSVGDVVVAPTRRIYESDVLAYVRFTNDVRCIMPRRHEPNAPLRAPDLFVFSLSIGILLHAEKTYVPREFVAFYGFDSIQFHNPAYVGDTIMSRAWVTEMTPRGTNGILTMAHEARTTDGRQLVSSVQRMLVRRRPASDFGEREGTDA